MTTKEFKEYVKMRKALNTEEIHRFMDAMSTEARRITFLLNTAYRTKYVGCFPNCLVIKCRRPFGYFLRFMRILERILLLGRTYLLMPVVIFKIMAG